MNTRKTSKTECRENCKLLIGNHFHIIIILCGCYIVAAYADADAVMLSGKRTKEKRTKIRQIKTI